MFFLDRFNMVFLKVALAILIAALVVSGLGLGYLSTIHNATVQLPAPDGRYAVGRILYDWVDQNRMDTLADQANVKREIEVWIWYPAQLDDQAEPAPYLPEAWVKARDKNQGLGFFAEYNFNKIQTHSNQNSAVSNDQSFYPVIIMEPGLGPIPTDYTVFAENLASQGFVVVGINPTYSSNLIMFPDQRVATRSSKGTIADNADPITAENNANSIGSVWVDDIIFVMNQLKGVNSNNASPLYKKLSLAHMGVFGHSLGGAAAIAACQRDARCDAGVDIDGTPLSKSSQAPIPQPFMFISEDYADACDSDCEAIRQAANTVSANSASYFLTVAGSKHFNFSDLPLRLLPPLRQYFNRAGYTGSIDPERALQITNAYLLAFFNKYLKNIDSDLLKGPSQAFPEVTFS
jgi:pimeloyl-ACP methyl ester carboxylesterase